jgi:hypothetical protein
MLQTTAATEMRAKMPLASQKKLAKIVSPSVTNLAATRPSPTYHLTKLSQDYFQ